MENVNRFTDTVSHYLRYRPSYPLEVLTLAINNCGLKAEDIIADIGSGTGFLAKLFLEHGNTVFGIEPNDVMRQAATHYLKDYKNFYQQAGTAENSGLKNQSVDFITVGTAFHWFDAKKTKVEFQRILKPKGWVLLVWNVRDIEHSPLIRDYENLIQTYGKDYKGSNAEKFDKTVMDEFFAPNKMLTATFKNSQQFDWQGFKGRLLSTSYSLRENDPGYEAMLQQLKVIFERYQTNNHVEFLYQTKVYFGQIHP